MNQLDKLLKLTQDNLDSDQEKLEISRILRGVSKIEIPKELEEEGAESSALFSLIKNMSMAQKIKLAIFGNQSARNILIRDPNRLIALFVLQNARLTENEIVEFARNKDLNEAVLREIAQNTQWMKSYSVKMSVVANPKVPANLALKWLGHILDKDLKKISKSREVAQVVSTQAKRLLAKKS